MLGRARDLLRRPHVIGYTARTDRYGGTRLVGHPAEIDLYALARFVEDPSVTADRVTSEFVSAHYGAAARRFVTRAFRNAFDIVTSSLYTLGTNVANHSRLDYDAYSSSYARHVSGKWIEPPVAHVKHGVNRDLHYWRDVVDRIAPPAVKEPKGAQWGEVPWVRDSGWIHPGERMDQATLRMVLTEKRWGVAKARESLRAIEDGRRVLRPLGIARADQHVSGTGREEPGQLAGARVAPRHRHAEDQVRVDLAQAEQPEAAVLGHAEGGVRGPGYQRLGRRGQQLRGHLRGVHAD